MVVNPLICGPSLEEDGSPSSSMLKQLVFWPHLIMYLVNMGCDGSSVFQAIKCVSHFNSKVRLFPFSLKCIYISFIR
jgi:hypothetical protein